jgi:hypothetical protein
MSLDLSDATPKAPIIRRVAFNMQIFKHKYIKPLQAVQVCVIFVVFALACVRLSKKSSAYDILSVLMVSREPKPLKSIFLKV